MTNDIRDRMGSFKLTRGSLVIAVERWLKDLAVDYAKMDEVSRHKEAEIYVDEFLATLSSPCATCGGRTPIKDVRTDAIASGSIHGDGRYHINITLSTACKTISIPVHVLVFYAPPAEEKPMAGPFPLTEEGIRQAIEATNESILPGGKPEAETCPNCHGTGMYDDQTCTFCDGERRVVLPGEKPDDA